MDIEQFRASCIVGRHSVEFNLVKGHVINLLYIYYVTLPPQERDVRDRGTVVKSVTEGIMLPGNTIPRTLPKLFTQEVGWVHSLITLIKVIIFVKNTYVMNIFVGLVNVH